MPHFLTTLLDADHRSRALAVEGRSDVLVATIIETAFDAASRKRGLLGRAALAPGTVLILAPCSAIHTFSMQFPIDVVFAARDGRVLKIRRTMPASRVAASARAFAVVELAAGEADRHGLRVGDVLVVRPAE